jgi:hypothetical protein
MRNDAEAISAELDAATAISLSANVRLSNSRASDSLDHEQYRHVLYS